MYHQEEQVTGPAEAASLSEDQKREQRARLIKAICRFKPHDANPQQFYNCVRELCIIHNCSIDEGVERAELTWPSLSQLQRDAYDSELHAMLPIPVPRHLLYHALQKERTGMWTLGRTSTGRKHTTRYTLESYKPPSKRSKLKAKLLENLPKYDNRLNLSPKVAAKYVPPPRKWTFSRPSPSSARRIRTVTSPPAGVQSTRPIGVGITKKNTRRNHEGLKKKLCFPESSKSSGGKGTRRKKINKRKGPKAKTTDRGIWTDSPLWEKAVGNVRRRLMMHLES